MESGSRGHATDLAASAALVLGAVVLYRGALDLFWIHDTPFHLRLLLQYPPLRFLLDPAPWREQSDVFTPLLFLSLLADRAVWGLSPWWFHLHHVLAVGACAAGLYGALRLWLVPSLALAGGAVFLLGPVVAASAPVLMVRHYVEALTLCTLALAAYVLALRRGRPGWAVVSALLYLAASLAKEIAVPLVLLLPLVPERTWRERMRAVVPHGAALAVYAAWRLWLLPHWLSPYGWVVETGGYAPLAWALPGKTFVELSGRLSPAGVVALAVLLVVLAALPRAGLLRLILAAAVSLATILPVSTEMEPRFALAVWLVLAAGFAFAAERLRGAGPRGWAAAGLAVAAVLVPLAIAGRGAWAGQLAAARRMSAEARFETRGAAVDWLGHPAAGPSVLGPLAWLREHAWGGGPGPGWYGDDLWLCAGRPVAGRIWRFDLAAGAMRDATAAALAAGRAHCAGIRWGAPLAARLTWPADGLRWQLGPHPEGRYSLVLDGGTARVPVPRTGGYRLAAGQVRLRVRYDSPEGWVTYSPELSLARGAAELRWER